MIRYPSELFAPQRQNSKGYRINEPASITSLLIEREKYIDHVWHAASMISGNHELKGELRKVTSPADENRVIAQVQDATSQEVAQALDAAQVGFEEWSCVSVTQRAKILRNAARSVRGKHC